MEKKRVIEFFSLFLFVFLISLSFANAQHQCSADKYVILRISSETNAHGEIHNGAGNYNTEICYDEIFGTGADPGSSPWTCEGTNNIVLKLSSNTNAHASGPEESYGINVCYADLQCSIKQSCSSDEKEIVQLSGTTNAHLETAIMSNYANIICCSSEKGSQTCGDGNVNGDEECDGINLDGKSCTSEDMGSGTLTCKADCSLDYSGCSGSSTLVKKAYWGESKYDTTPISEETTIKMNEKVWLIARGFTLNEDVEFKIYEDDSFSDDLIIGGLNVLVETRGSTTLAAYEFNPQSRILELEGARDSASDNILELYFIAEEGGIKRTSQTIKLDLTPVTPPPQPTTCDKYTTEPTCIADADNAKVNTAGYNATKCGLSGWTCKCVWDNSACKYSEIYEAPVDPSSPGGSSGTAIEIHYCDKIRTYGSCINEKMTATDNNVFTAIPLDCNSWNNPGECNSAKTNCEIGGGDMEIPCGGSTLTLPFFGLMQAAGVSFLMVIIYFILLRTTAINKKDSKSIKGQAF